MLHHLLTPSFLLSQLVVTHLGVALLFMCRIDDLIVIVFQLYENFLSDFEHRINPLALTEICVLVAKQISGTALGFYILPLMAPFVLEVLRMAKF